MTGFTTHSDLAQCLQLHATALEALPYEYRQANRVAGETIISFIRHASDILVEQDRKIGDATVIMRQLREVLPTQERLLVTEWLAKKETK